MYEAHKSLPAVQLCPVKEIKIRKQGHLVITPQFGSEWSLCRGVAKVQYPTNFLWSQPFNHDHCFTFVVETNGPLPDSLEFPVHVEYINRGGEVEFYLTLEAVHKLSETVDIANRSLPSNSPSLSDEEQKAFYVCSEEGLHSSGSTSSIATAARDSSSSQKSVIQHSANVHKVKQCEVTPSYSKALEESQMQVRLPVGSEVPYKGCTLRYIDATGHTVREVPGKRLDSRTIETVTPAWPCADRVEIHIVSSDDQTRLGCLVHDFVETSAVELLRTCRKHDDDSIVPASAEGQETKKEHEELDLESNVSDKQLMEVGKAVSSDWRQIGINLEVELEELSDCEQHHPRNADRIIHVFSLWKKRVSKPTIVILLKACRKAGVGGAAERALKKGQDQK